jgi:hypothetical protein
MNQRQSAVRSQNAQYSSNRRQKKGFRDQLTNDPDAARADRGAHRQLMLPRRAPRQQ